jgi:hypothetical protein
MEILATWIEENENVFLFMLGFGALIFLILDTFNFNIKKWIKGKLKSMGGMFY